MLFSRFKTQPVTADGRSARPPGPLPHVPEIHAVNGNRIQPPFPDGLQTAVFGAGCFWGVEKVFWEAPGVYSTAAGYAGRLHARTRRTRRSARRGPGTPRSCSSVYDPAVISYEQLLKVFWEDHDPTQGMRQGNDIGTQYRSAIYVADAGAGGGRPRQPRPVPGAADRGRRTARSPPRSRRWPRSTTPRTTTSSTLSKRVRRLLPGATRRGRRPAPQASAASGRRQPHRGAGGRVGRDRTGARPRRCFGRLRRDPDVEAPDLVAVDATDRLLLDEAAALLAACGPGEVVVVDDSYGALTLGAVALHGARRRPGAPGPARR